jgi:hypothetical protein
LCDISCNGCENNPKNCLECNKLKSYIKKPENNDCILLNENKNYYDENKGQGYFFDQNKGIFNICGKSCNKCFQSADQCITCNTGYLQLQNNPKDCRNDENKPNNYFRDKDKYSPCDNSCSTCIDNERKCVECNKNYLPLENYKSICITNDKDNYFYEDLKQGYFKSIISNKFLLCDISCYTCIEKKNKCLECKNNYFPLEDYKTTCINISFKNYYDEINRQGYYLFSNYMFKKCNEECNTCDGPNLDNCLSCKKDGFEISNGKCLKINKCPSGFLNYNEKCIEQSKCSKSLNVPKIFDIDLNPLIISLLDNLSDECRIFQERINYRWNKESYLFNIANISNNNSTYSIDSNYLETGNKFFSIDIFFDNEFFETIKGNIVLVNRNVKIYLIYLFLVNSKI